MGPGHGDLFTAITILSNERKVTLLEFYSYLIAHEAQSTAIGTTVEFTTSANNVTRQDPSSNPLVAISTTSAGIPTTIIPSEIITEEAMVGDMGVVVEGAMVRDIKCVTYQVTQH